MKKKTLAAFEVWKAEPRNWSELVQRVAEGETLREVCASKGVPYSLVAREIAGNQAIKAEYDAALQIWADALAQETLKVADDTEGAEEAAHVSAAKLRVETRLKLAGKWDRERYGEREAPRVAVQINLGDAAREIAELERRLNVNQPAALPQSLPIEKAEVI